METLPAIDAKLDDLGARILTLRLQIAAGTLQAIACQDAPGRAEAARTVLYTLEDLRRELLASAGPLDASLPALAEIADLLDEARDLID